MNHRSHGLANLVGIAILITVVLLLMTSRDVLFSPVTTFIDTELYRSSGNEASVRTKMDFGSQEHMTAFPREIGKWVGYDYDTTKYVELLGADIMLLRGYEPSTFTQPLFFLILQANTESSFHPPKVCIRAQGHEIQEEGDEKVVVTDATWVKGSSSTSIPLKKLVTTKNSKDGRVMERRVVLFCYVKGNQFYTDTITMLQIEALAPLSGSYEDTLNEEKSFLIQAMPLMFEPSGKSQWYPLVMWLIERGIAGYLVIAFLLLVPIMVICYPRIRWRKEDTQRSKPEE
jgi:hypothetical protein